MELIELGIEASKQKEKAFFELAERFRASKDSEEAKQLGDRLGRFVFGDNAAIHLSPPFIQPAGTKLGSSQRPMASCTLLLWALMEND